MIHHVLFSGSVIGTSHPGRDSSSLYVLDTLRLPSSATPGRVSSVVSSPTSSFAKWHHRLGHLCGSRLSTLVHQGCLGYVFVDSTFHCKGSLENIYNFHIRLVGLILFDHLTLFIRMYGVLHLLLPRVVTSIKLFLLMTILATHGFISWNISVSCVLFTNPLFAWFTHNFLLLLEFFALTLVVSTCLMLFANFCPQKVLFLSSRVLALMLKTVLLNVNIVIS